MILGANDLGGFSVSVVVCCFDLFDWQLLPSYFLSKMRAKNKRTKKNKGIKKNNSNKKDVDFDP